MKIYAKDPNGNSTAFDLGQFLNDQKKTLIGPVARAGGPVSIDRWDVVYKAKDNETGEVETFDAKQFLADQGMEIDVLKNFEQEQSEIKGARRQNRYDEIKRLEKETKGILKEARSPVGKFAELELKTLFPNTYQRLQSERAGKTEPSTLSTVGLAAWDALSNMVKGPIAAFEAGLFKATDGDRGRPFMVSLQRMSDYGPDIDEKTGDEATLTESLSALKNAVRVDPMGVAADLAIESGRDPLMAAGLVSGPVGWVGGLTVDAIKGTKTAASVIRMASKYKKIAAPAIAATKFAKKVNDKVLESNVLGRGLKKIVGEGVEGGIQGVLWNQLQDTERNKLNTFVVEGVEEALFAGPMFVAAGGAQTIWSKAWGGLNKQEQKNALINKNREVVEKKKSSPIPDDVPWTPEELYNTIDISEPKPDQLGEAISSMTPAETLVAQDALAAMALPITAPVPPGTSRKELIKKIKDPMHKTPSEEAVAIEHDANAREARKKLNEIKKLNQEMLDQVNTDVEKISKEALKEIDTEDAEYDAEELTWEQELKRDMEEYKDPSSATSFSTWKKIRGVGYPEGEHAERYKEFRIQEEKSINEFKESINPTPKETPKIEEPTGPKFVEEPTPIEIDPEVDIEGDQTVSDVPLEKYVEEKQKPIEAEKETLKKELEQLTKQSENPETPVDDGEVQRRQQMLAELEATPEKQKQAHRSEVQKAVSAGKPIAPEVLKDYPGMKPRSFDVSKKEALKAQIQSSLGKSVQSSPMGLTTDITPKESSVPDLNEMDTSPKETTEKSNRAVNLVDESELDNIIKKINAKLAPGRLYSNPMFDPELLKDIIHAGMIFVQKGTNDFVAWSEQMISAIGEKVKPFLRSAYNAINAHPKDRKFNPDLAVKIFEYGGILREEGASEAQIKTELEEAFGAGDYSDFVNKGLQFYPTIEQLQEQNNADILNGDGANGSNQVSSDQESRPDLASGEGARTEGGLDSGLDDGDGLGTSDPFRVESEILEEEGNGPGESPRVFKDIFVKKNLDLRSVSPVEMTPKARSEMNDKAEEILSRAKTDPESLTQEDRMVLRQYTGKGGLNVSKLDVEDIAGSLNQHYTSYSVAKFIWNLVESIGFNLKGVEALEPTAGIGNFAGMAPREVKWTLNEVDLVSGEIMGLLYPESEVTIQPFESYIGQKKDLVVTNVPFLENRGAFSSREADARYSSIKSLHDYIMMKSIDQLQDNGLGVFITSTWTMDKKNPETRKQINQKAEVLAVIRTPMGAYQKNTQYAGSTDIIIVRKRTAGEMQNYSAEERIQEDFVNTIPVSVTLKDGTVQQTQRTKWFEVNRSQAIGEWTYGNSKGGLSSSTSIDASKEMFDSALNERFNAVIEELKGAYVPGIGATLSSDMIGVGEDLGKASPETPKFGLEVRDGQVLKSDQYGRLRALRTDEEAKKSISDEHMIIVVKLMQVATDIRDKIAQGADVKYLQDKAIGLIEKYQALPKYHRQPQEGTGKNAKALLPGVTEKNITETLPSGKKIRKRSGYQFSHNAMLAYTSTDSRYALLRYLYSKDLTSIGDRLTKPAVSSKAPDIKKGNMKNGSDVKSYVMKKYGVFRTTDAREAWEGDPEEFESAMMQEPDLNRHGTEFIHDNDYLVGNMADKLEFSKKHNLTAQVEKIMNVLPEQKTGATVDKNPVSTWWTKEALTDFGRSNGFLGQGQQIQRLKIGLQTKFRVTTGQGQNVQIHENSADPQLSNFVNIVLNQKNAKMVDPASPIDEPRYIDDLPETARIRESFVKKFEEWANDKGQKHAEIAAKNYNENFAVKSQSNYSQVEMFIKGVAPMMFGKPFVPFRTQLSAVRMAMNQFGGVFAHDVGNGKTMAAIMSFAALRDIGRAKKTTVCCPDGTIGMWESNFLEAIQGVKVKVIHSTPATLRRSDLADAAANEYDVLLISHGAMKSIPLRKSKMYIEEEIEQARKAAEEWERRSNSNKRLSDAEIKRIEKKVLKLQSKLEGIAKVEKDILGGVFYEDLGTDMIIIDEAHNHKNVNVQSYEFADKQFLKLGAESSHMGDDMVHKTRYIHEINERGNVFSLSATPTPNSIIEIYTAIRFVAPWEWESRGIYSIDDFIRNFVEIGPLGQAKLTGTVDDKEGVIGFKNGKALNDIVRSWVDYKEATPESQKGLPPSIKKSAIVEPNDEQLNMLGEIAVLDEMNVKELRAMGINKLTLTGRAKALAVDPAAENPKLLEQYPKVYNRAPKIKQVLDDLKSEFEAHPDRNNLIFLQNYKIKDFRPMKNAEGEQIEWPAGFGQIDSDENGREARPPKFFDGLLPEEINRMTTLMKSPPNYAAWDAKLLDKNGFPKTMKEETLNEFKPLFDEESGKIYIQEEFVAQNLHEEIRKHAIEVIGMDPDRIMIVNGNSNNKPEDKTRLENLSSVGALSLVIGNSVMSEGLNLQEKGNAIFTVDVPWTPKTVTQSNGRFLRSRSDLNDNVPVKLYNYALRYSADKKLYEILEKKADFNKELQYGDWDVLDNSINNEENIEMKLSEELTTSIHIIEGHKAKFQVVKEGLELKAAMKFEKIAAKDVERAKKNYADAVQKIENARAAIDAGNAKHAEAEQKVMEWNKAHPDKLKTLPEPYDPSYHLDIIKRNTPAAESGQSFIDEAMKAYEPYRRITEDLEQNELAQALLIDARRNNWHTIGDDIEKMEDGPEKDSRRSMLSNFLTKVLPWITGKYPRVADMAVRANVSAPLDSPEAVNQMAERIRKHQGGFASPAVMAHVASISTSLLLLPAYPQVLGITAVGYGLYYAPKVWRSFNAKNSLWSIRARLQEMNGFSTLGPLIDHVVTEKQRVIAGESMDYKKTVKGLTLEEREAIPAYIEGTMTDVPDNVRRAAEGVRLYFVNKSAELRRVGYAIQENLLYFPRSFRWDMVQKMKTDPDLLLENARHIVLDKDNDIKNLEDAFGVLLSMYDDTAEMRQERRLEENTKMINMLSEKYPNISHAGLIRAMASMKHKYGLNRSGNIKYARKAPKLLDKMYFRDPNDVMKSYIEDVNSAIIERAYLGDETSNNNAVNDFLNANYPIRTDGKNEQRDEVRLWFKAELAGSGLPYGKVLSPNQSRKLRAFQYWTKLGIPLLSSVYAPAKNVLGLFNMALPIAGGRATAMGIMKTLGDSTTGFNYARHAGAISNRILLEVHGDAGSDAKSTFGKLADSIKEWGPFGISEKFVRAWAFHSGSSLAQRLWIEANEKGDADSLNKLMRMIGENHYNESILSGGLTPKASDMAGVFMANMIGGKTSAFDMASWMTTPEGRVLMQFHSMAYAQTNVFKNEILKPARNGNVAPLLKWLTAAGTSTYLMVQLTAAVTAFVGGEDPEDMEQWEEADDVFKAAWAALMLSNMVFATGMFGDLAAGAETLPGVTPYVSTMAGPTINTIANGVTDMAKYGAESLSSAAGGEHEDDPYRHLKNIIGRELPGLNFLRKAGHIPELEKE